MKSPKKIIESYNRIHKEMYAKRARKFSRSEIFKRRLSTLWHKMTLDLLSKLDVKDKRILDVGCGYGVLAIRLAQREADAVGVDISSQSIKISKEYSDLFRTSVHLIQADAQFLPFCPGVFGLSLSLETLEHIPDYNKATKEIIRVTKTSGYIIIIIPNILNPVRLVTKVKGDQPVENPFNYFTFLKYFRGMKVNLLEVGT